MGVQFAHDVALGDDADDTLVADHHHGPDVLIREAGEQLFHRRLGVDGHHRRTLVPQDVRNPHQGLQPVVIRFAPGYD